MKFQNTFITFLEKWDQHRVRNHIGYWVFTAFVFLALRLVYGRELESSIFIKLFYLPAQLVANYLLVYYLIPKYLLPRKYITFLISFALSSYLLCVLLRFMVIYGLESVIAPEMEKDGIYDILTNFYAIFGQYLLLLYLPVIFFILLKYAKDAFLIRRRIEKIKQEKSIAELNFLKAQVHPHFLFNTLNNIYLLALRKTPKATEVVKQLADMMEYMMLTCNQNLVTIGHEIDLIRNYLDLETLRYGERLNFKFEHQVDDENIEVAPLILLSFVENAFKHGVSGDINEPKVYIHLELKNGILNFEVFNTKSIHKQKDEKEYKKGIGVSNVKRQLDLIYQNRYDLRIVEQEKTYKAKLKMQLLKRKPNPIKQTEWLIAQS